MSADPIGEAVSWLRDGRLLAYPTETVWGLGVDARSEEALERLRSWKGRDDAQPISILVEGAAQLERMGVDLAGGAGRLAAAFWPGPLTLVVACTERFARGVARSDGAVGVRCSSHPLAAVIARRLSRQNLGPMTATSLNRSGAASARTREQARASCGGELNDPRLLDVEGAEAGGGRESTVVDLTGSAPQVVRWGALPEGVLGPVIEEIVSA